MNRPTIVACIVAALGCSGPPTPEFVHRTLPPFQNTFRSDPAYRPQPHRDRPLRVAVTPDGARALVTLQGLEDEPGRSVAVVDLRAGRVTERIEVGSSPTSVVIHPNGRFAVVTNRYSNWASVIDLDTNRVVRDVPTDFFATDLVFTPDGRRAYVSNRWHNTVVRWDIDASASTFNVTNPRAASLPASTHPRDVAISPDGTRLAVGGLDGMRVHLYELPSERLVANIDIHAAINDVLFAGSWLIVLTQGVGSGHPALVGPDTDGDGRPGDSTANSNFQDQQNDIAIVRASDGAIERRYTSDTTCCRDFRDVPHDHPTLGAFLPPRDTWIVGGAVPEAGALCGPAASPTLWVAYLGSSDVESFAFDPAAGTLRALERGRVGFAPTHISCTASGAAVVSQLGETLDLVEQPGRVPTSVVVGDVSSGTFPQTMVEIGEVLNVASGPYTVDGDQSCVMCHREFGNVERAFSMPLLRSPEGTRLTMAHRGLADTRPWFFETAMDENNFFPVLNEFARIENFCCTSTQLWTADRPAPPDCATRPPPICAMQPYPRNYPTRNAFYEAVSQTYLGRTRGPADEGNELLNFTGLTRALGQSLLARSRMLPNPNASDTAEVRRGRAVFESPETGCSTCHFGPGFSASFASGRSTRVRFGPVISPLRTPDGRNVDLVSDGFISTFPDTTQRGDRIEFGVPMLRGIWARANIFLHDGRARNLRETLATPGHPALRAGERGFNEVDGIPDTHGATSQLNARQLEDLIAYLLTL